MQITDQTSEMIQHDALEEAISMFIVQEQRGVSQITTATACALLIGQIVGQAAKDEAHMLTGLDHLTRVMRLCAADWLHANVMKN